MEANVCRLTMVERKIQRRVKSTETVILLAGPWMQPNLIPQRNKCSRLRWKSLNTFVLKPDKTELCKMISTPVTETDIVGIDSCQFPRRLNCSYGAILCTLELRSWVFLQANSCISILSHITANKCHDFKVDPVRFAPIRPECSWDVLSSDGRPSMGHTHGAALWDHVRWRDAQTQCPVLTNWGTHISLGHWQSHGTRQGVPQTMGLQVWYSRRRLFCIICIEMISIYMWILSQFINTYS